MIKRAQSDEEKKELQQEQEQEQEQAPQQSQIIRLDSNGDQICMSEKQPKKTPSGSPLLYKNNPLANEQRQEPKNPTVTPFQPSNKKITFEGVHSDLSLKSPSKQHEEVIPYEKYHRNGNIGLNLLNLPQTNTFTQKFPFIFLLLLFLFFPFGILLAYLSSRFNKAAFTFLNCWLLVLFFTLSFLQQLILLKNGLCKYILSKSELDYWNEPKFVKILWAIRFGLLVLNLSLTIYYGFIVWDEVVAASVLTIFIYLSILVVINLVCVIVIFYFIIPVTNKQMITIKERMKKFKKLQDNYQIPLSFQFMNSLLGIQMHGSEGHIYQSIVASQNYQKFIIEVEERQRELLVIARSRNDKLSHDASDFINQLTKKLKEKKDHQINISRVSNPGLSPFDLLVSYISFFFVYCIGYPIFLYFALLYQSIDQSYLPLIYFCYPICVISWKRITLGFFNLKQFYDYNYETKIVIFAVTSYRIGAMSIQSLESSKFVELLLIKFTCKIIGFWIEVYGYQYSLEQKKQQYMSFIRGSTVDKSNEKNKLSNQPTLDMQQSQMTNVMNSIKKRMSTYEATKSETPSFTKTAANWQNVDMIDNIKKSLITKQIYNFIILEASEFIFSFLFLIFSQVLYTEVEVDERWDSFNKTNDNHNVFQLQIGVEIIFEVIFVSVTLFMYKNVKMHINYKFYQQLTEILGIDGLKSLIYDFFFALVITFLIVGNKFQVI